MQLRVLQKGSAKVVRPLFSFGVTLWSIFLMLLSPFHHFFRMSERGVEFKGVAFVTVLAVLTVSAVLESTLPSFLLSDKMQDKEAKVTVLVVVAVSVVTWLQSVLTLYRLVQSATVGIYFRLHGT